MCNDRSSWRRSELLGVARMAKSPRFDVGIRGTAGGAWPRRVGFKAVGNWSCVERFEADVPMVIYVACALTPETDFRVGWREIEEVPC